MKEAPNRAMEKAVTGSVRQNTPTASPMRKKRKAVYEDQERISEGYFHFHKGINLVLGKVSLEAGRENSCIGDEQVPERQE